MLLHGMKISDSMIAEHHVLRCTFGVTVNAFVVQHDVLDTAGLCPDLLAGQCLALTDKEFASSLGRCKHASCTLHNV